MRIPGWVGKVLKSVGLALLAVAEQKVAEKLKK